MSTDFFAEALMYAQGYLDSHNMKDAAHTPVDTWNVVGISNEFAEQYRRYRELCEEYGQISSPIARAWEAFQSSGYTKFYDFRIRVGVVWDDLNKVSTKHVFSDSGYLMVDSVARYVFNNLRTEGGTATADYSLELFGNPAYWWHAKHWKDTKSGDDRI